MTDKNHNSKDFPRGQRIDSPLLPRLLPLKDAAIYLGLSTWALRERIWSGLLPFVRYPGGRKLFLDLQDLDRFIDQNKVTFGQ